MKKLYINGEIIPDDDQWMYDLLEMSATSHKKVKSFVDESGTDDLEIYINSPGGSVHAGSAIYDELRAYKGKTTAYITGIAASAATLIMLGAQKVVSMPTAQMMIHNPQTYTAGDYRQMEQTAAVLKSYNDSIINAYEIKTKLSREKIQELMDSTTFMSAQKALEYGFVDEIALKDGESMAAIENALKTSAGVTNQLSSTLNTVKLRELLKKPEETSTDKLKFTSPNGKSWSILVDASGDYHLRKTANPPNDNGGASQPVADIAQRDTYNAKKYKKMEVLSK